MAQIDFQNRKLNVIFDNGRPIRLEAPKIEFKPFLGNYFNEEQRSITKSFSPFVVDLGQNQEIKKIQSFKLKKGRTKSQNKNINNRLVQVRGQKQSVVRTAVTQGRTVNGQNVLLKRDVNEKGTITSPNEQRVPLFRQQLQEVIKNRQKVFKEQVPKNKPMVGTFQPLNANRSVVKNNIFEIAEAIRAQNQSKLQASIPRGNPTIKQTVIDSFKQDFREQAEKDLYEQNFVEKYLATTGDFLDQFPDYVQKLRPDFITDMQSKAQRERDLNQLLKESAQQAETSNQILKDQQITKNLPNQAKEVAKTGEKIKDTVGSVPSSGGVVEGAFANLQSGAIGFAIGAVALALLKR